MIDKTKKQTPQIKLTCEYNSHVLLTIGKKYEILAEEENKVFVMNDKGEKKSYYKSRFK